MAPNGVYTASGTASLRPRGTHSPAETQGASRNVRPAADRAAGGPRPLPARRLHAQERGRRTCALAACGWPALGDVLVRGWPSGASAGIYRGRGGARLLLATVSSVAATSAICGQCDSSRLQPCFFARGSGNMVTVAFQPMGSHGWRRALRGVLTPRAVVAVCPDLPRWSFPVCRWRVPFRKPGEISLFLAVPRRGVKFVGERTDVLWLPGQSWFAGAFDPRGVRGIPVSPAAARRGTQGQAAFLSLAQRGPRQPLSSRPGGDAVSAFRA